MKKWLVLVMIMLGVGRVSAQEVMFADEMLSPSQPESQSYTYMVKEDGSARVWMRIDGVVMPKTGGQYQLTLPEKVVGEVWGWYRENGCLHRVEGQCIWEGNNAWKEVKVERDGKELTLTIPARNVAITDLQTPITLGLGFGMSDVTVKKWWGREVKINTAAGKSVVNYLGVGVYMPDGVYVRDRQNGPANWSRRLDEVAMSQVDQSAPAMVTKMVGPLWLEMAGKGIINRYRQNLLPGENYSFSFVSATSWWKLFCPEMGMGVGWILGIAIVISLLLRMLVGRKPWGWYLGVMLLLSILLILIGGLWWTMQNVGGKGVSLMPAVRMDKTMSVGVGTPEEITVSEPGLEPESLPAGIKE